MGVPRDPDGIRAPNAFRDVKMKEIMYYRYLNGESIPHGSVRIRQSRTEEILARFVKRTDSGNSLALFNVISAARRFPARQ
jgi:hypothetical protein